MTGGEATNRRGWEDLGWRISGKSTRRGVVVVDPGQAVTSPFFSSFPLEPVRLCSSLLYIPPLRPPLPLCVPSASRREFKALVMINCPQTRRRRRWPWCHSWWKKRSGDDDDGNDDHPRHRRAYSSRTSYSTFRHFIKYLCRLFSLVAAALVGRELFKGCPFETELPILLHTDDEKSSSIFVQREE